MTDLLPHISNGNSFSNSSKGSIVGIAPLPSQLKDDKKFQTSLKLNKDKMHTIMEIEENNDDIYLKPPNQIYPKIALKRNIETDLNVAQSKYKDKIRNEEDINFEIPQYFKQSTKQKDPDEEEKQEEEYDDEEEEEYEGDDTE